MSKASGAVTKRVTADWAESFSDFDTWRPLRLLRRIGPVLQGITLDLSSSGDAYFPTSHVHALTRKFPVVSLTLGQRLSGSSGVQESIQFSAHERDFSGAAQRLAEQSSLPLLAPLGIEEVVVAYHSFAASQQEKSFPPAVREMEDSILIPAAAGNIDLTEESLRVAREFASSWPKSRLPLDWVDADEWIKKLKEAAQNPDTILAVVEQQISAHKLEKVRII